jgi:hypothetical protein
MGVERTDYIVFGFKMNPELLKRKRINIWDDKYLPFIEGHKGVPDVFVYDGMNEEYAVFGKLINRAEEHEGVNFTTISYKDFFDVEESSRVIGKFIELFGEDMLDELDDDEPQMFVFSHYH